MPVPTIYIEKNLERGMRKPEQKERIMLALLIPVSLEPGTVFERAIRHSVYIYPTSECHVECAEIQVESIRKYICREFKFRQRKG